MNLLNRYKGTLVGVHVGDAIGAPYETWGPQKIVEDLTTRGDLQFFDYPNPWAKDGNGKTLPAGRPTDDSDQTADLCHSLIECNGIDPAHLRKSLQNSVFGNISRLWEGKATGAGGTTRDTLCDDPKRNAKGFANNIGTNGSLMRCAPMALWLQNAIWPDEQPRNGHHLTPLKQHVYDMSAVTHTHSTSKQACWIYTIVLSALLYGEKPEEVLAVVAGMDTSLHYDPLFNRLMWSVDDKGVFPYDPGAWPMRGTAEFSLYVALYALLNTKSFEEGIELAVRVGGDTDTYAAIAGGLLGAYYGYDAIPEDWKNTILGHDIMVDYAEKLYDMRLYK